MAEMQPKPDLVTAD